MITLYLHGLTLRRRLSCPASWCTRLRADPLLSCPFRHLSAVAALKALAADVRAILGAGTKVSYAADWSGYFGHQPADGSNDVNFHLDPLRADPNIDFVGIDNYMPLSDWRDRGAHLDALAGWGSIHDLDYLKVDLPGKSGEHQFEGAGGVPCHEVGR